MSVNTDYLLEVLRFEYSKRINEVLGEADVFDDKGNVVISPDLKVRHKKSGYEYTVAHVKGDKDGEVKIVLREPEEPRFDAPPEGEEVLGGPETDKSLNEQDAAPLVADPRIPMLLDPEDVVEEDPIDAIAALVDEKPKEEVVFVIDQSEFEKEYEVE